MDKVIRLGGEHSLDKILDVAENHSKSFCGRGRVCKRLDLDALHDGSKSLACWSIEDCFERALVDTRGCIARHVADERKEERRVRERGDEKMVLRYKKFGGGEVQRCQHR